MGNLAPITKRGLMPGRVARRPSASARQLSPFPPADDWCNENGGVKPRANACCRVGGPDYDVL
eukprot:1617562-Alexandrium_andersonii.AAC.1